MKNLNEIKNVYFVGIGGIGMSALARYFKINGYKVGGYDRAETPLTRKMAQEEGIEVNYVDDVAEIAKEYHDKDKTLVVFTPAIPADNLQLNFFKDQGFDIHKRAEVLGLLSKAGKALCIAGTHGKTTTSTMLAFLLKNSNVGCNAFLGGISENFNSNLLIDTKSPYIVIEADEYDRSFLHLYPEIAVITSMDADHLDIYGSKDKMIEAFDNFADNVRTNGGKLFIKDGLSLPRNKADATYCIDKGDCYAYNLRKDDGCYIFDYHNPEVEIKDIKIGIAGRLNVENATVAITLALKAGATPEEIRIAFPQFKGVNRRFNIKIRNDKFMYIDDYAHHPQEIEATLKSVKEIWPEKHLKVIFQPHLFSRTKDFYNEFAKSLSIADEVVLLDIYPAREKPMSGVTAKLILDGLTVKGRIVSKEEILHEMETQPQEGIVMTMGAGDVDKIVPLMIERLTSTAAA